MKKLVLLGLFSVMGSMAHADIVYVSGVAAQELWQKLNIESVEVRDEHGGNAYAVAKYGANLGCQKAIDGEDVECWFTK